MPLLIDALGAQPLVVAVAGQALDLARTSTVAISQGRDSADSQPDAASCQLTCYADALPGGALPAVGDPLTVHLGDSARVYLGLADPQKLTTTQQTFESSTALGWMAHTNAALTVSTEQVRSGAAALKLSAVAAGNVIVTTNNSPTHSPPLLAAVGGRVYSAHAYSQAGTTARTCRIRVIFYTSARAYLGEANGTNVANSTTEWTQHTVTATAPADAAYMVLQFLALNTAAGGEVHYLDDASLVDQTATWTAARPRFVGTITDLRAVPAGAGLEGPGILTVTATGAKARLGRLVIGDVPWPAELDGARASRIVQAVQDATGSAFTVGGMDPGTVTVLGRDVDAQPALELLDGLANEAGAVFTARRDGALEWHDAEHRRNVTQNALQITAGNVLRNAVWEQGLQGMVNDLSLSYGPEGTSGQPVLRSTDATSISAYGRIASQLSTQLLDEATTQLRLGDILGRRSRPRWRLAQLHLDVLRTVGPSLAAQLAGLELGRLVLITGFPESGPFVTARLFVEGWDETFARNDWSLRLSVSEYALTGPAPRWADVHDATTWANLPADVTWLSSVGWYPGEPLTGRWLDVPADQSWAEQPNTTTWTTADQLWA